MLLTPGRIAFLLAATMLFPVLSLMAQAPKSGTAPATTGMTLSTEKALAMAQQGRCKETFPTLNCAASGSDPPETKKQTAFFELKCAISSDDLRSRTELLRRL